MNRFAKMKKERIYTLFETLSESLNINHLLHIKNIEEWKSSINA